MKSFLKWSIATIFFTFSLFNYAALAQTEGEPEAFPSYQCKILKGPNRGKAFVLSQAEDPKVYGYNLPIGTKSITVPHFDNLAFKKTGFDTVSTYGNGLKFSHPSIENVFGVLVYKASAGPKKFKAEIVLVDNQSILAFKVKCKRFKK